MLSGNCARVFVFLVLQFVPGIVLAESPTPSTNDAAEAPHANQLRFEIEGMSCGSCVNSITEALRSTPGVEDAVVTLEPQRAEVKLKSEGTPSAEQLIKVITDLGYTAKLSSS